MINRTKHLITALLALGFIMVLAPAVMAVENDECMECHSDAALSRDQSSGMKEMLYINYNNFKHSVHNINGIACVDCHADIEELDWEQEIPHPVTLEPVDCASCHEDISEAYRNSVHHKARTKGITIPCYACHEYHYTSHLEAASVKERQNNFCMKCHKPSMFHDWLPQKEAHFDFVECTVCHAPDSPRHINLRVYDLVQDRFLDPDEFLRNLRTSFDGFLGLIDRNGNSTIDEDEFLDMVILLRQWEIRATFHGELVTDVQASVHQVNRGEANRDCAQCHTATSPYFEDVRFSLARADGTVVHYPVDRDVLETYHVEFNALGSTRVRLLDKIGLLLIAGGVFVVIVHLTTRLFTLPLRRDKRDKK